MKRSLAAIVLASILLLGIFLIYSYLTVDSDSGQEEVVVRLKWLHQAQFIGFYAAEQLGYYTEAGIDVDLLPGGVDQPAVFQVVTGSADFGVTGADQVLLARKQGHKIKAIALIYRQTPFTLFSKNDPRYEALGDFRGKRVGVKYGGNEEITYRAMIAAAGLDSEEFIEVGVKYDMTPFFADEIVLWPGYRINEPLSAKERGIDVKLFNPEDVGVELYADTLIASERVLETRPALARRFVAATIRGWKEALDAPGSSVSFVTAYNPDADLQHELAMIEASIPLVYFDEEPIGEMSLSGWQNVASVLGRDGQKFSQDEILSAFTNVYLPSSESGSQ